MHIEQFVQDTIEVTKYILQYLNQERLYLVGHSWGTIIGLLAIHRAPHLFNRYFGIAQVSQVKTSERLSYNKLLEITQAEHNDKAYKTLEKIGPPPWNHLKQDRVTKNMLSV